MSWTLLATLILVLATAILVLLSRRHELAEIRRGVEERAKAREGGSHRARLQYPSVDLSRCIGCGVCVRACPEDGVLGIVHGQAVVLHGARCVGHGRCATECPVGAIAVTLGDLSERRDIPVLTERLESTRTPGLFLAGEVTGFALIRTAIAQGTAVADEVARRCVEAPLPKRAGVAAAAEGARSPAAALAVAVGGCGGDADPDGVLDLVVVGAGPAGLACSLRAKEHGLAFALLDQEGLGGTVAKYPRRKLVMTQPVTLPLVGTLAKTTYSKEELIELWAEVVGRERLPLHAGEELAKVVRAGDHLEVHTKTRVWRARAVCLALGRRGTPRKLGVPGEDLPKVSYSLLDAQGYQGRRILVVGGGDSAVEAAVGLTEQPGNLVTLSYRKSAFSRIKARNQARLDEALAAGRLELALGTEVARIGEHTVDLRLGENEERTLANDEVFVFAGGTPPFELLEASGVSFDPAERPRAEAIAEQGTGLLPALAVALALAVGAAIWTLVFADYYGLAEHERVASPWHRHLRPAGTVGLALGVGAAAAVLANLAYLARRSQRFAWIPGSLQRWMTAHVATGIGALLLALVHSAMAPGDTVGGHAFAALCVLVATGAVGRYLYSFVPRAANGRELELSEVEGAFAALSSEWDRENRSFGEELRAEIERLGRVRWQRSFPRRLASLVASHRAIGGAIARLRAQGLAEGVPAEQVDAIAALARRAQRTALAAAHFEEVRALLATWRWIHRWVALAMVLLVVIHVVTALRYGRFG